MIKFQQTSLFLWAYAETIHKAIRQSLKSSSWLIRNDVLQFSHWPNPNQKPLLPMPPVGLTVRREGCVDASAESAGSLPVRLCPKETPKKERKEKSTEKRTGENGCGGRRNQKGKLKDMDLVFRLEAIAFTTKRRKQRSQRRRTCPRFPAPKPSP